jgi:class 3 adenylate cyclase
VNNTLTGTLTKDTGATVSSTARLLIVDDDSTNRLVLKGALTAQGYDVIVAEDGLRALMILRTDKAIDLVLLDVVMPEMDGIDVLRFMKGEAALSHVPVIMISALDDAERIAACLEMGAEDYLSKPFNPAILKARVSSSLSRKQWRDFERSYLSKVVNGEVKSDQLISSLLPREIATRLKNGEQLIADNYDNASVLFLDLVGFTAWTRDKAANMVVEMLNSVFSDLDKLVAEHTVEKIKTIGDAYMVAAGLGSEMETSENTAVSLAKFALSARDLIANSGLGLEARIGIHSGPLVAGVIGSDKPIYDVWGDTVNVASRLESHGEAGRIQISEDTLALLTDAFHTTERGMVELKNRGAVKTYWLEGQ